VRWAEGEVERLPALVKELVARKPAVLLAASASAVMHLATGAPNIPIVQASGASPVQTGLAASLARPGGMVTGITSLVKS